MATFSAAMTVGCFSACSSLRKERLSEQDMSSLSKTSASDILDLAAPLSMRRLRRSHESRHRHTRTAHHYHQSMPYSGRHCQERTRLRCQRLQQTKYWTWQRPGTSFGSVPM